MDRIRIGVIGDYTPANPTHVATNAALGHAASAVGVQVAVSWLPTTALAQPGSETLLEGHDALLASPGSPYRSLEGALAGIAFARRRGKPFVGT